MAGIDQQYYCFLHHLVRQFSINLVLVFNLNCELILSVAFDSHMEGLKISCYLEESADAVHIFLQKLPENESQLINGFKIVVVQGIQIGS